MYDSSAITQPRAEQESEQVAMQQEERVLTEQSMQKDKQDMEAREESANMVEDAGMLPIEKWTESDVSSWMRSIGVKEQYIQKLEKEEVNGKILLELTEDDLKQETGITSLVARLIIRKRNEFVDKGLKTKEIKGSQQSGHGRQKGGKKGKKDVDHKKDETDQICPEAEPQAHQDQLVCVLPTKRDCKPRPLGKEGIDFTYAKHNVLQPESGAFDLIYPCHEYKSLRNATKLDRTRLQAKFAKEVLKFGTGCMNIRSNGTIHFGVMDSKDDAGYVHGEIIGVPVLEKDIYSDALDHIEKCFSSSDSEHVRQCIRPPQFIEVMDIKSTETRYVVEVDIVPSISIVKNRVYSVRLPNFKESTNKIELEKKTIYRRVGSKTEPVSDENVFYQRVRDRDDQREKAEHCPSNTPDICEDLGRKLTKLITSGKKFIANEKWYILVTNKFKQDDLSSIDFLLNLKIFCVFDFDPDSRLSGLCSKYIQHHAANMHFLQSYKIPSNMSVEEFERHLHLFEQTSWIFCNGRNDYQGNEIPSDEMTWIKTKMTLLRESVSLICKQILPKGTFSVIFLLTSPVEKPLLHTFLEFFTDMEGHEDIICISESEDNYQKWQRFAEGSCETETVNSSSVVGMKMSHVDATLQQIQPVTSRATKHLPVYVKGQCHLETREEEQMHSLDILSVDHCDETSEDFIEEEMDNIERQFYHGGKVTWLNFWLAEKKFVGEVIQRDAYREVSKCLSDILKWGVAQVPVNSINIYHHPGSGGSTVARQVLWNNRKDLRCAVVKPSYSAATVSEHAVQLREYEETNPQKCLPVLLLVEDSTWDYVDDIRKELEVAISTKKIKQGTLCFVLLSCSFSYDPEKMYKNLQSFAVTQKLSPEEKRLFASKRDGLKEKYPLEFILTFVLMSEDFKPEYVEHFVKDLLKGIDHESVGTRLIKYVALLNIFVQNSFISQSHCEALLTFTTLTTANKSDQRKETEQKRFPQHAFEKHLSEQAKLLFTHSNDEKTHIQAIKIIHPRVAKEILQQLLDNEQQQEKVAMDLLHEDVLFQHRFAREPYVTFLRDLFMRRYRVDKGDKSDSLFSPLIELVRKETPEKAIKLLEEAHKRFDQDAFFAQQLARLNYCYEKFEEAEVWAVKAETKLPNNSFILDTKGHVYRRWFDAKCNAIDQVPKTAENIAGAIETALKAMECFQKCETIAISDPETMNNAGFFGTVTVGCSLLKLMFSMPVFSDKTANGCTERLNYLLTEDYIPKEVMKPWEKFHSKLKNLQKRLHESLEWISDDLSFFQTDISSDQEEASENLDNKHPKNWSVHKPIANRGTSAQSSEKMSHPKNWLTNKSSFYGKTFSDVSVSAILKQCKSNPQSLTPFTKRMAIYHLGGGNLTTIFSLLTEQKDENPQSLRDKEQKQKKDQHQVKKKHPVKVLEDIISLYPSNPLSARLDQKDLVNYIATHIALSCLSTPSTKLAGLKQLQTLSNQFTQDRKKCLSGALFLLTLLFWPEEHDSDEEKERKYDIVHSAVESLEDSYRTKMKDIPPKKRRIYTHVFLGNGIGLEKIVHKSKVASITKLVSLPERRIKWLSGEVWKMPEIAKLFKCVSGWTEDGTVYLVGPTKKFAIHSLHAGSVPYGSENVTFYLGFTFRGPVAYNITVKR
ncbi:sterile alpha motif domain-containing protein 9-like isoform X1 [Oncorhynchus nerka]|uniref:sterile alpha motif domain-containing protein 9-like isoform X1 n=3 Tax=Oncorhynchus nerka TaxID=8023 RepID=UPI0031B83B8C